MLNVLFRGAVRLARTPLFRLATPWACAWALWAPAVPAAGPQAPEEAASAPFKRYQGWRDEPLNDWRAVNDRVGEVGGWRTYLRESQPEGGDAARDQQGQPGHHGH